MKKIVFCLTLLLFVVKSFSQSAAFSTDHYLKKSKNQKTAGLILLGSGVAIAVSGGIYQSESNGFLDFTGAIIAVAGGVVILSSIPFFKSSAKNKRKAASIAFRNQPVFLSQQNTFHLKTQPTFTLKMKLYNRKKTIPWYSSIDPLLTPSIICDLFYYR